MLGVDWLLSEGDAATSQLHFIESNSAPGIAGHDLRWKRTMGEDLVTGAVELTRRLHEAPQDQILREGERFWGKGAAPDNWWQLAFSETAEKCRARAFNPCPGGT